MQWIKGRTRQQGALTEQLALTYLLENNLSHLESNFRCKLGEIDLIMQQGELIVFVEVKYRKSLSFGGPMLAVSKQKQRKLTKTAYYYLQINALNAYNTPCRFDVVTLLGAIDSPEITWIKDAFTGA